VGVCLPFFFIIHDKLALLKLREDYWPVMSLADAQEVQQVPSVQQGLEDQLRAGFLGFLQGQSEPLKLNIVLFEEMPQALASFICCFSGGASFLALISGAVWW